ncbi:hypothetical protein ACHAXR_003241 [Thalassiosira sp. AJA248-18]
MKYPNGCRYVGTFFENKRHGYGKVCYPNGLGIYTGYWKKNKRHGHGTMEFANGDMYKGEWVGGVACGVGTLVMLKKNSNSSVGSSSSRSAVAAGAAGAAESVEVYTGSFSNQKKDGRGIYKYPNGDVYEGEWSNGVQHGSGVMMFHNGGVERRVYYRGTLLK